MKIVCAWCKAEMGEKCPKCVDGPPLKPVTDGDPMFYADLNPTSKELPVSKGLFFCNTCNFAFSEGYGGTTHGMCEGCLAEKMKEIKDRRRAGGVL